MREKEPQTRPGKDRGLRIKNDADLHLKKCLIKIKSTNYTRGRVSPISGDASDYFVFDGIKKSFAITMTT